MYLLSANSGKKMSEEDTEIPWAIFLYKNWVGQSALKWKKPTRLRKVWLSRNVSEFKSCKCVLYSYNVRQKGNGQNMNIACIIGYLSYEVGIFSHIVVTAV